MEKVECVVIGAGAVGLAIARELARRGREVVIIERNSLIGSETSSRNNEVIHAGFLYPPDSLRGRLCHPGAESLINYCQDHNVDVAARGKLLLALDDKEINLLHSFIELGQACGVDDLTFLRPEKVAEIEPDINCLAALYSPSTAIVDSHALMLAYLGDAEEAGAVLALNTNVVSGSVDNAGGVLNVVGEDGEEYQLGWSCLINAAGLGAKNIADKIQGTRSNDPPDIFYAKGSFFSLTGRTPFEHIIVPLGETLAGGGAFTLDNGGRGKFGPDLEWVDTIDYTVDPNKAAQFAAAISKYWKDIDVKRLQPDYSGIRPRSWGQNDPPGEWIIETPEAHGIPGLINLFGIETPGLTASLAISKYVADALMLERTL